jgi:Trk-type K+ transport system membrane component
VPLIIKPLSAAGGIKVTTFAIVFIFVLNAICKENTVSLLHIAFKTKIKTIANVVTLIPPAALRGAPPINISATIVLIWEILKLLPLYY